jgi:ATP-binding cassette subfamily B protein
LFDQFTNSITINKLQFRYPGNDKNVLNNISLTIRKRTSIAIVGESGSGKSTIVALLLKLYPVKKGSICIDDHDINEYNHEMYLKKFGYVSQDIFLFHGTIRENIAFGTEVADADIISACKKADAHGFISKMKESYDTIVGDSGMKLSGGQKQRISIARALLRKPEILIFDEPTSSLDNKSERAILSTLNRIARDLTVIIIAHRLSTISSVDSIYYLKDGKIIEHGTHKELLKANGFYRKLFEHAS